MLPVRDPCRPSSRSPLPRSAASCREFSLDLAPIVAYPAVVEALVERLSQLDSQAEGAIRVVMFYDTLIRRRADLSALARASAGRAGGGGGIRPHGTGRVIRVSPDAGQASGPPAPASTTASITLDEEEIGPVGRGTPRPPRPP